MRNSTKLFSETPIEIYTDGSCINYKDAETRARKGYGGWAFVVVWKNEDGNAYRQGRLDPPQTNQTAELYAVLHALKFVIANRLGHQRVIIVSDSKYAINGMTSQMRHQAAEFGFDIPNGGIWKELHELAEMLPRVRYRHVRGHRGNKYNEMADRMASFARRGRAQ